jgi:hypothetical protein
MNQNNFAVPQSWRDFITFSLLNPASFDWAKSFLNTQGWQIIRIDSKLEVAVQFSIPQACPVTEAPPCIGFQEEDLLGNDNPEHQTPDKVHSSRECSYKTISCWFSKR